MNVFKFGVKSLIEMFLLKFYILFCLELDVKEELFGRFVGNISSLLYLEFDFWYLRDYIVILWVFLVK